MGYLRAAEPAAFPAFDAEFPIVKLEEQCGASVVVEMYGVDNVR